MKHYAKFLALVFVIGLASCTKESIKEQDVQHDNTIAMMDWTTGVQIGTIYLNQDVAGDRDDQTYYNFMAGASTKFGCQGNFYLGGVLVASSAWYWVEAGLTYSVTFLGDDSNSYNFVMNYKRKLPTVPCNLTIYWYSPCGGSTAPETFTIGTNGASKSHVFQPCS